MPRIELRRRRRAPLATSDTSDTTPMPAIQSAVPTFPSWAFPSPDIWIGQLRRDLSGKGRAPA